MSLETLFCATLVMGVFWWHHVDPGVGGTSELAAQVARLMATACEVYNHEPHRALLMAAERRISAVRELPVTEMLNPVRRTVRRGKFSRQDGVIYVATKRHDGTPLPPAIVNGYLIHEVAHAISGAQHSSTWLATYEALLRLATVKLGWEVVLERGACKMYGVCDPVQCLECTTKA